MSCESCDNVYIRQTKRKMADRTKEHLRHMKYLEPNQSAIAERTLNTNHKIDTNNINILANQPRYYLRIDKNSQEQK